MKYFSKHRTFENVLCTYCVLGPMLKTPWPKIEELYPERCGYGDKTGRYMNTCNGTWQKWGMPCYRTRLTGQGEALTQWGWAFGLEHGEMGRQVRKEHGHWRVEKTAIF